MEIEKRNSYNYVIYARKSTEDEGKQILSIESQIAELKDLAQKRGLQVMAVLHEAKSAKKVGRPVFNQVLQMLRKGEVQGIIAWKLDRLSRNPYDSAQIETMLQEGLIKHIVTFDRECLPNDNVVMRAIEFSMANQYVIDLSNNIRRGNKHKLEKSVLPGLPPLGYLNYVDEYGNKSIIKDPQTFDSVKMLWDMLLNGKKVEEILTIADKDLKLRTRKSRKRGGNPLSKSTLYSLFANPFYAGIIRRKQDTALWENKGIHEPMITVSEFDEAQYILGRKGRPRSKKHEFAYTGVIRCGECGGMITAEEKFKKTRAGVAHYIYYHCSKRKKDVKCGQEGCLRVEYIEKQVLSYLERITVPDKFRDWAIKHIEEIKDTSEKEVQQIIQSQKQTLQKIDTSLNRLTDLVIEGVLNNEEYTKRKHDLQHQKWVLDEKIRHSELNMQGWLEPTRDLIIWLNQAVNWFIEGNVEEKREILKIIGLNHTLTDKILLFQAVKPFNIFEDLAKNPVLWWKLDDVRTFFTKEANSGVLPLVIKNKIDNFVKALAQ